MEKGYNFRVVSTEYHRGFCPTLCRTLDDALEEQLFWNMHTDFLWAVEGLTDEAEQELSDYWDAYAAEQMDLMANRK